MAQWGFDFVRLPLSYRCWSDPHNWRKMDQRRLEEIDRAVEFGRQYKLHVCINFHRAPGYCVNRPKEPMDLWTQEEAVQACAYHWSHFAERFKGFPNSRISFDLLNEPSIIPEVTYVRVIRRLVEAIRAKDPERLIIADGLSWGRKPVHGLVELGIAQSTRGYDPMRISHHKASWIYGADKWPVPKSWPLKVGEHDVWGKERLRRELIEPWKALERKGVGVHVGEWGAYRFTPHHVVLAWMRDLLDLWKRAGWGWAMWNLRGAFGPLDSEREDVKYENFRGHKLDRKMLELLRADV
jgi:endoglucanase